MSLRDSRAAQPARGFAPGDELAGFVLLERLGAGGTAVVFAARDDRRGRGARVVALKILDPSPDPSRRAQLLASAEHLAELRHPNVIAIEEVGVIDDRVCLVMERIAGPTLGEWAEDRERPWPELVARWIAAGRGLEAAHAFGLVHCDFKPANVLITEDERRAVLADFGLGPSPGTQRYMAPESLRDGRVDARSDQFGFCVSLWEALEGRHPFAEAAGELAEALALGSAGAGAEPRQPLAAREVPERLRRALTRGLAPDPAERFPDMSALLAELEAQLKAADSPSSWRRWLDKLGST